MASAHPLRSRADCEANFDLIRSWISQCERHPICARSPLFAPQIQLPTRLIDVNTGSEDSALRLVIPADFEDIADSRYVALSHCWGDPRTVQVPKTLRNTLKEHQKRITSLTQTFKDAIEVTKQIGVRYLWIDSLCIIQDEPEDFMRECSRMSLIYARAYCVLSALDAEDGSGGLFIPRNSYSSPSSSQISLNNEQWTSMLRGPLSTRGWAFQEHQLSPRIIHFTKARILWECRVCIACEDSPSQCYRALVGSVNLWKDPQSQYATWRLFDGKHERYDKNMEGGLESPGSTTYRNGGRNDMHTRWLRAVELYSSRNLTYETDKLPAISGLATATIAVLGEDDYLAGLWKNDLIRGLLWTAASSGTREIPNRVSSIPSWSWASYCGSISFLSLEEGRIPGKLTIDHIYKLGDKAKLTAYTNTSSLYPFGEVKGGTLQITALIKAYDIGPHPGGSKCKIVDKDRPNLDIFLDNPSTPAHRGVTFAVLIQPSNHRPGVGNPFMYGLVLKKSDSSTFQRLGVFCTNRYTHPQFSVGFKLDTMRVE
jgi:hypothetical protein